MVASGFGSAHKEGERERERRKGGRDSFVRCEASSTGLFVRQWVGNAVSCDQWIASVHTLMINVVKQCCDTGAFGKCIWALTV